LEERGTGGIRGPVGNSHMKRTVMLLGKIPLKQNRLDYQPLFRKRA